MVNVKYFCALILWPTLSQPLLAAESTSTCGRLPENILLSQHTPTVADNPRKRTNPLMNLHQKKSGTSTQRSREVITSHVNKEKDLAWTFFWIKAKIRFLQYSKMGWLLPYIHAEIIIHSYNCNYTKFEVDQIRPYVHSKKKKKKSQMKYIF